MKKIQLHLKLTKNKELSEDDKKKKELVKVIDKSTKNQKTETQAIDNLDNNQEDAERMKQLLSDLSTNPDDRGSNISGARASRMLKLQNDFLDSKFEGEVYKRYYRSRFAKS